jgi:hypothetical protein
MPRDFACPDDPKALLQGTTSYAAVAGPDGNWSNARPSSTDNAAQDRENPVLLVEAPGGEIIWTEPRDLTLDEACDLLRRPPGPGTASRHAPKNFLWEGQGGSHAFFADGLVRRIPANVPESLLRAALLGDRQKQAEMDEFRPSFGGRPRWSNLIGLGLLIACLAAKLQRLLRLR